MFNLLHFKTLPDSPCRGHVPLCRLVVQDISNRKSFPLKRRKKEIQIKLQILDRLRLRSTISKLMPTFKIYLQNKFYPQNR